MNKLKSIIGSITRKLFSNTKDGSKKKSKSEEKSFFSKLPLKIKLIIYGVSGIIALLFGGGLATMPQPHTETPPKVCTTQQTSTSNSNDSDVSGDWTKDGTSANKVAKEVWDFWNKKGYSAAAIAGVVGNSYAESGFNPIVAQGGGSIMTDTPQGGGAGLYQFTPYTKFANIGDSKWKDVGAQNDFVWSSEANGFRGYATVTTVSEAAEKWFGLYERGDPSVAHMDKRISAAEEAYKMWGSTASKTGSESDSVVGQASANANSNSTSKAASDANGCQTDSGQSNGSIAKIFDDKYKGLVLNAGLDDPNHEFINSMNGGKPGVNGPGAHDGWDVNSIGDPGGTAEESIYAAAGGKIVGLSRGDNGANLTITIKLENGNYLQYQEFKTGSIPSSLQKDQNIKAGTKIGEIGSAEGTGGVHFGAYVHISYYTKSVQLNGTGGVEHFGATKDTLSLGELLGIKADKWVHASQSYTWSDMTALSK